jgi:signal transduction histidine kinase
MFRDLRLHLTGLYLVAALALMLLVGGGAYTLLRYYFQSSTDLALQYRMAQELRQRGLPIPAELLAADQSWAQQHRPQVARPATRTEDEEEPEEHEEDDEDEHDREQRAAAFDADLAALFVLPLDANGRLLLPPGTLAAPIIPDQQAVAVALRQGHAWQSMQLPDGTQARLLTYRLSAHDGPALLQVGRLLNDQTRVLQQLLGGLLALGALMTLIIGAGSWWLAGRALLPAQQAWERQQTFIANASHELRTPLTLIRASTEMALRHPPTEAGDHRELLTDVLQECDHTARLVDELLLLSRLDAGQVNLHPQPVVLADLLADLVRQMGRVAEERGVWLGVEQAAGSAWADPTRLRQVLLILLDNALRATPAGGRITLASRPQGQQVQLEVHDTGCGIAHEHQAHVFDRFYRCDGARTSAQGGSGLGLAIAKALVEAHGGQISLISAPGHGTRLTVALPTAPASTIP